MIDREKVFYLRFYVNENERLRVQGAKGRADSLLEAATKDSLNEDGYAKRQRAKKQKTKPTDLFQQSKLGFGHEKFRKKKLRGTQLS